MSHHDVICQYFNNLTGNFVPSDSSFLFLCLRLCWELPTTLVGATTSAAWRDAAECLLDLHLSVFSPFQKHNCVLLTTNHL